MATCEELSKDTAALKHAVSELEAKLKDFPLMAKQLGEIHVAIAGNKPLGIVGFAQKYDDMMEALDTLKTRVDQLHIDRQVQAGVSAALGFIGGMILPLVGFVIEYFSKGKS